MRAWGTRSSFISGLCPDRLPIALARPNPAFGASTTHASFSTRQCSSAGDKTPPVLVEDGSRFTWQREDLAVVLIEPKIPQNSGNVSRTCAATKVPLHLVAPAFQLDDKKLKRAGLDYWDWVCLKPHASVEAFLEFYHNLVRCFCSVD